MIKISKKNKKGIMWDILIPLILGLLVVAIVMFWIFQEYFTDETTNTEVCKQSVLLRNTLPEYDLVKFGTGDRSLFSKSFKDEYPLRCQTARIIIDYPDTETATKEILDKMAECWFIMGKGEYNIYPSRAFFADSYCYACAQIHFTNDVIDHYKEDPINILKGLDNELDQGISYKEYLTARGKNPSLTTENFNDSFSIEDRETDGKKDSKIIFPKIINVTKGDFFITTSTIILSENSALTQLIFYSWNDATILDELSTKNKFVVMSGKLNKDGELELDNEKGTDVPICKNWDGIPA